MRVTARLSLLMIVLAGLLVSPAAARPREDKDADKKQRSESSEAQASPTPSATPSSTPSASPSPSPSDSGRPGSGGGGDTGKEPDPTGPTPTLEIESTSSELLVQVGNTFRYTVTIRNTSQDALEGVVVLDEVAPELDVVSVPVPDDVEGVQLGRSPAGEDIVWNVGRMGAGQEITLEWVARATSAGDFAAVNEVRAEAEQTPSRSLRSTTFLASDEGVDSSNPAAAPVTKEVVVLGTRLVRAPSTTGAVLPVTGMQVLPYVAGAAALIALGLYLASSARRRSRVLVGALLTTLLVSACVSSPEQDAADQPRGEATEAAPDPEPKPSDKVLGKRIQRDPQEAGEGETGAEDGTGAEDVADLDEEVQEAVPEFVTEEFREVKTVVVDPKELSAPLASRAGDNTISFDWDLDTRSIPLATSGVIFSREATTELMTSLDVEGDVIGVVVTLANVGDVPVDVSGHLVHVVSGADGKIAEFTSEPIDMVLNPGGKVTAEFSYLLPTGSYSSTSEFRAN